MVPQWADGEIRHDSLQRQPSRTIPGTSMAIPQFASLLSKCSELATLSERLGAPAKMSNSLSQFASGGLAVAPPHHTLKEYPSRQ
jgi:hypothetical protein